MFSFWFFNDQMFFNKVDKLIKTVDYIIPYIVDALIVHPSRWMIDTEDFASGCDDCERRIQL